MRIGCMVALISAFTAITYAQCGGTCYPVGSPSGVPESGYTWVWDYSSCQWVQEPGYGYPSPILIDTDGTGFHLTSATDGVLFDFYGDGTPIQIAWTAKGSRNGWLALPRNGKITSARDLFGSITAQPMAAGQPPNGFAALSIYDTTAYGGNNDGAIDTNDAVWPNLRVWIDLDHDGVAQPEELHTLSEIGIERIYLRYGLFPYHDEFGNQFRYKGSLVPVRNEDVGRKVFDVVLATE